MSIGQKIIQLGIGVAILLGAIFLILIPDESVEVLAGLLAIMLFIAGIQYMVLYFTMARHMVGGRNIFYTGLIILDLSFIGGSILTKDQQYMLLYFVGMQAFYGVIQLLRAFENKRYENAAWRMKCFNAVISLLIAVTCLFFIKSTDTMIIIYGIGMVHTALTRILSALKREEPAVIQ